MHPDSKEDIGKSLVAEGLALVEKRREKRFQKMVMDYISAQEAAKKSRVCFFLNECRQECIIYVRGWNGYFV